MDPIRSSTTANFAAADAGGSLGLTIENDPSEYSGGDDIHLLLFPAVSANIRADVGTVKLGGQKVLAVPGGVVVMQGIAVSLPKRADGENPEFAVMMAFDKKGQPITPGITYDPATGVIRSDRECTAVISFSAYKTRALQFIYTPKFASIGSGGRAATFGTVAAFYPPDSVVTFPVTPAGGVGESTFEIYRIVSPAITTRDGEFEKPPNFPTSGAYPDKPLVLDTATFLETERVHEIGSMNATGTVFIDTHFVSKLEPYIGDASYQIPKVLKPSTLPTDLFPPDIVLRAKNEVARRGQGKIDRGLV